MSLGKLSATYMDEINEMFKSHPEAVLALYADGLRSGRRSGQLSTLLFMGMGIVTFGLWSCAAWLTYLEHKEKQT